MSLNSFSRRRLLASIAAAGGAARLGPFVPSAVRAAVAPKRILTIFHPMGYLERSFWPTGAGADYTLGETMTALNPWKSKLLFLDGLAMYGAQYFFSFPDNEHGLGAAMCFTGGKYIENVGSDSPSLDQVIADYQYNQVKTQFRSLNLGVNSAATPHNAVFYSKGATPIAGQRSPKAAFDQLFSGFTGPTAPPTGGPTPPPTQPAPDANTGRLAQEQSVLNFVKGDLSRVRGLAGKDDQDRLDSHLDGISSLENRLKLMNGAGAPSTPKPGSGAPAVPAGSSTVGCAKPSAFLTGSLDATVHAQMDLIAAAFACDMTRSASLQLGVCDGSMDDAVPGVNQHNTTHGSTPDAAQSVFDNHMKFDRWYAARWAYLLNKLDSIKEGNGTLLDNTLVVFSSDTSTGTTAPMMFGAHLTRRIPMWMAGGGNFAFKTGQYLKLPNVARPTGRPAELAAGWIAHHRLLTSICQAFGMPQESFGGNDPGRGGITQLTRV